MSLITVLVFDRLEKILNETNQNDPLLCEDLRQIWEIFAIICALMIHVK